MSGLLQDRVVVVTGGGRGIGASVSRVFAAEGAKVVVNDLGVAVDGADASAAPVSEVVKEIQAAGGEAQSNASDVSDYEAAGELVKQAIDSYGRLDVLVNVAGILRDRMIFNLTKEDWDAVIDVHLTGTFNTMRHACTYFRELRNPEGQFRIINFTSGSGLHGGAGQPNYAAAKAGIVGLTYSTANAMKKYGVTCNAIAPAAQTRMTESVPTGTAVWDPDKPDLRSPDNIVPPVAYLASTRSDWCTGQVLYAAGFDIALYSVPQAIRLLRAPTKWSLDDAFEAIESTFPPAVIPNHGPPMAGVTFKKWS